MDYTVRDVSLLLAAIACWLSSSQKSKYNRENIHEHAVGTLMTYKWLTTNQIGNKCQLLKIIKMYVPLKFTFFLL